MLQFIQKNTPELPSAFICPSDPPCLDFAHYIVHVLQLVILTIIGPTNLDLETALSFSHTFHLVEFALLFLGHTLIFVNVGMTFIGLFILNQSVTIMLHVVAAR